MEPIFTETFECDIPESPFTLDKSIIVPGDANLSFIIGIRDWPPARSLESPLFERSSNASSTSFGGIVIKIFRKHENTPKLTHLVIWA
jgi:hypothetical protein